MRATVIATSNNQFGRWGEVFGDSTVAAMIDRPVHQDEVVSLKGGIYRLKGRDLGARLSAPQSSNTTGTSAHPPWPTTLPTGTSRCHCPGRCRLGDRAQASERERFLFPRGK